MKKLIALALALVMLVSLVACGGSNTPTTDPSTNPSTNPSTSPSTAPSTNPATNPSQDEPDLGATFTVVVTDLDGSETTFQYTSEAATVGEALLAEGLIAGDQSDWGLMVTTVNGITADWATENAYWAFYINGEYAMTGVDSTELIDGATYSFVKTVSYTVLGEGTTTFYFTAKDVDGTVTKYEIHTDATTVGAALVALNVISGDKSDWGLYVTTVNGITADWATENAYWAFYIDGAYAQTGVDATEITAGATYEMVKTISYTVLGEGATTFYFTAKDVDGTVTKYEIHTDATTVGTALVALNIISGNESDWGLYVTTVNGITADWATENAYWAFYIDGAYAQTGVDSTDIVAGSTYEMVKTISYTVLGEGATTFYFTVKDVDNTVTRFEIHTDKTTVGAALVELGLIAGDESDWGLYVTTVNGITADWDTEKAYWAFYIGEEYAQTGVDATEIVAGTTYTFAKTVSE